jgi:hypothetical protein
LEKCLLKKNCRFATMPLFFLCNPSNTPWACGGGTGVGIHRQTVRSVPLGFHTIRPRGSVGTTHDGSGSISLYESERMSSFNRRRRARSSWSRERPNFRARELCNARPSRNPCSVALATTCGCLLSVSFTPSPERQSFRAKHGSSRLRALARAEDDRTVWERGCRANP